MRETGMAFPLLPGKREALIQFAETLGGARKEEYDRAQASVLRESWFIQPTPQGDLIIVHMEAPDPEAVFVNLAMSEEPFDIWFREQVQDLTGVDLAILPPSFRVPECVFQWARA